MRLLNFQFTMPVNNKRVSSVSINGVKVAPLYKYLLMYQKRKRYDSSDALPVQVLLSVKSELQRP